VTGRRELPKHGRLVSRLLFGAAAMFAFGFALVPLVKRFVHLCSICRKAGHIKTNCPGVKTTKKVNYVYQNAEKDHVSWKPTEDSEEPEIEYVLEEEVRADSEPEIEYVLEEEVEVEEDVEYVDDDDSTLNTSDRNCYAIKKKWYEVQYL
jgi:hypothetical protein